MSDIIEKTGSVAEGFEESMRRAEQEAGISLEDSYYVNDYPATEKTKAALERAGVAVPEPAPDEPKVEAEVEPEKEPDTQVSEPEPESDPLAELNKKVGQLINENADLRRALSEQPDASELLSNYLAAAQQQQQGTYTPDQFETLLENDPASATMLAHQRGDQFGYARAWHAWNEVAPGAPQIWADNQALRAQLAEFQQNIGKQIAPAQQAAEAQELESALRAVEARHTDFREVMGTLGSAENLEATHGRLPKRLREALETGDREDKEAVFETLYHWQKSLNSDQLVQAAREAPARQSEEAREAKREAFVASASTTTPDEVPETEQERLTRVWKEQRPSMRDAWNRGEPSRLGR